MPSDGAFAFDEGFEGFPDQGRFLRNAGVPLGETYQSVIQRDSGSHKNS